MSVDNTVEMLLTVEMLDGDDEELDNIVRQLHRELDDLGLTTVQRVSSDLLPVGAKGIDPTLLAALVVSTTPILLTKFLDFLRDWCMRNERKFIKVKIQKKSGESVEIEVPVGMSATEVKIWIETVREELTPGKN